MRYLNSTKANYTDDVVYNKGMRENGTPLSAYSGIISFHQNGWFIDLSGNYYDRIYLSYAPSMRYEGTLISAGNVDNDGNYIVPEQAKGKGGFMLDASIGKSIRLGHNSLSLNLTITNLLNNRHIVTGGYEQSRSDYTLSSTGTRTDRAYKFSMNPKKFYINGINGMFNVAYKF